MSIETFFAAISSAFVPVMAALILAYGLLHNAPVYDYFIEGAKKVIDLDYQIPVPACVQAAIDEYRSQNDWFGHFMEDKCETGDGFRESSSSLYQAYRNYCIDTNEYVRSTADFYFAMESAGFERVTLNRKRYFKGVRLRTDTDDAGDNFLT